MNSLAIIIPAFKVTFFDKALRSLAQQTNKNFTVYVGDDHSPDDLKSVCDKYNNSINIKYTRFNENIGAKQLVKQWNRCVMLSGQEEWLWLFSDDDMADKNCVEVFYKTIQEDNGRFDVYKFDKNIIDDNDAIGEISPVSPFIEPSHLMAIEILMGRRGNCMPDHIFSRKVYEKNGGLVYTDYAQGADWATSILFSSDKGICTMQGAKINWRYGASNITGQFQLNRNEKIKGYVQFLNWLLAHFNNPAHESKFPGFYSKIKDAAEMNLNVILRNHYRKVGFARYQDIYRFFLKTTKNSGKAIRKTNRLYFNILLKPFMKTKMRSIKNRFIGFKMSVH